MSRTAAPKANTEARLREGAPVSRTDDIEAAALSSEGPFVRWGGHTAPMLYRGWQFFCCVEQVGRAAASEFRSVVAYCRRWPEEDLRLLPSDGSASRTEAEAFHRARRQARQWADSLSAAA